MGHEQVLPGVSLVYDLSVRIKQPPYIILRKKKNVRVIIMMCFQTKVKGETWSDYLGLTRNKAESGSPMSDEPENVASEEEPCDPFKIDRLTVHYDYLLYKIQDYVSSIHLHTTEICKRQNELVTKEVIEGIIDENIAELQKLLVQCEELESSFDMLDQIDVIVQTFKQRIEDVVKEHKSLKKKDRWSTTKLFFPGPSQSSFADT